MTSTPRSRSFSDRSSLAWASARTSRPCSRSLSIAYPPVSPVAPVIRNLPVPIWKSPSKGDKMSVDIQMVDGGSLNVNRHPKIFRRKADDAEVKGPSGGDAEADREGCCVRVPREGDRRD